MDLISHVIITAFLQKVHSWAICLTAFWVTVICSQETESLAKRSEDIKLHYAIDMRYMVNSWQNVRYANHYMSLMDRALCPVSVQINFWNYDSCTYLVYTNPKDCYSRVCKRTSCPSLCQHVSSLLQPDRLAWNFIMGICLHICWKILYLVQVRQKYRDISTKT